MCFVYWGKKGCTNNLGDRRDLKADALMGSLQREQFHTKYETPNLAHPSRRHNKDVRSYPINPNLPSVPHVKRLLITHLLSPRQKSPSVSPCTRYIQRLKKMRINEEEKKGHTRSRIPFVNTLARKVREWMLLQIVGGTYWWQSSASKQGGVATVEEPARRSIIYENALSIRMALSGR